MSFLKNFFDDDGAIVGLSGFKGMKKRYSTKSIEPEVFFNPFQQTAKAFASNYSKNPLLF